MKTLGCQFQADELPHFEKCDFELSPQDDGPLFATLVRRSDLTQSSTGALDPRPAVLYLHGFVDYFFQTHMAEAFENAGFRFYALDMRRYGRSLRAPNRQNFAGQIDDYFEEIDLAIEQITRSHPRIAAMVAHSTGGLIAAHYLSRGKLRAQVERLALNSPFLRFVLKPHDRLLSQITRYAGKVFPHIPLPQRLNSVYGQTLHRSQQGSWDYDLSKKPLAGFGLYSGWFTMILDAQSQLDRLDLHLPILCLHSSVSHIPDDTPSEADFVSDTVLDVEDMKRLAPTMGSDVRLVEIKNGLHDLILSKQPARGKALAELIRFAEGQAADD